MSRLWERRGAVECCRASHKGGGGGDRDARLWESDSEVSVVAGKAGPSRRRLLLRRIRQQRPAATLALFAVWPLTTAAPPERNPSPANLTAPGPSGGAPGPGPVGQWLIMSEPPSLLGNPPRSQPRQHRPQPYTLHRDQAVQAFAQCARAQDGSVRKGRACARCAVRQGRHEFASHRGQSFVPAEDGAVSMRTFLAIGCGQNHSRGCI